MAQILQKAGFESSNSRRDSRSAGAVHDVPVRRCELLLRHVEAVEKAQGVTPKRGAPPGFQISPVWVFLRTVVRPALPVRVT